MSGTITRLCDLQPLRARVVRPRWALAQLAGRLTEISGHGAVASLTAAMTLVLEAQTQGDPTAWIAARSSMFFPPDAAASGVDLDALAVVRVPAPHAAARAADRLVRSGAFALVVIDLGARARIQMASQGRLVGLAQRHDTAIVCLTDKPDSAPSIGSMISLRARAMREHAATSGPGADSDSFRCNLVALKDKRYGPRWTHTEIVRGPDGMC